MVMRQSWKCPSCGKIVTDHPALSRKDNRTEICSDCGQKEALDDFFGATKKEDNNAEQLPADHEPDNLWCSCRACCCRNGMCTHGE